MCVIKKLDVLACHQPSTLNAIIEIDDFMSKSFTRRKNNLLIPRRF